MPTFEEIAALYESLPQAFDDKWRVQFLVGDRLAIGTDAAGCRVVFLVCPQDSLSGVRLFEGMEHRSDVFIPEKNQQISALRIKFPQGNDGERAAIHVATEFASTLARSRECAPVDLIRSAAWLLQLLGGQSLLSNDEQKGLVGELELLRELLLVCMDHGFSPLRAVERWLGPDRAKRDFAAEGIAIEAKATGRPERVHLIGGLAQLEPHAASEEVFLYSIGVETDSSSPKKLPAFVEDIGLQIARDDDAVALFRLKLTEYGYDSGKAAAYKALRGFRPFHLQPRLFRCSDLDGLRLSSFKDEKLPSMVGTEIRWSLLVHSKPLNDVDHRAALGRLLQALPIR